MEPPIVPTIVVYPVVWQSTVGSLVHALRVPERGQWRVGLSDPLRALSLKLHQEHDLALSEIGHRIGWAGSSELRILLLVPNGDTVASIERRRSILWHVRRAQEQLARTFRDKHLQVCAYCVGKSVIPIRDTFADEPEVIRELI